ncbi:uncharacterized protein TRUGW13939_00143 [Talaromyces rugulosus]|uniref:Ion transport domain-containing protein n=1 Tax=Talaromyces rugulosus TaxID=121627 RepID=A0A7H8QHM5_TALRU|nr:uncharacterized protein TRUGW13939_00143 [Talaromyces rugulosus]QKX53072.1 hypothetical protein TRUGW13939_00143 [Talaromyces rugulosus]
MVARLSQSFSSRMLDDDELDMPEIGNENSMEEVARKIARYIIAAIPDVPCTFDDMRSSVVGQRLRPLVKYLSETVHNQNLIRALMVLKWHFDNLPDDEIGLNESRGYACEFVAWQFLTSLSHRETIEFLLQDLLDSRQHSINIGDAERGSSGYAAITEEPRISHERTPLLSASASSGHGFFESNRSFSTGVTFDATSIYGTHSEFDGVNALEIAAIVHAKKFLSQKVVQKIIDDIWRGEIIFWDSLNVHAKKMPHVLRKKNIDPYCRLRIPIYRKAFEAVFFISFLVIYYAVLAQRDPNSINMLEILMYIWITAFAYDELSGITDAGMLFYQLDFWSLWNVGIIGVGIAFLDLFPSQPEFLFWELGFLTTFTMLARDRLTLSQMSWILVKVFFGSATLGLDVAQEISPVFGYGLMIIFVCMTNILLISSVISLMSLSLEGVMAHAREEYLFQWVSLLSFVAQKSEKLADMNLIPLLCLRPLRLILSSEALRRLRIVLLKITHAPFVMIILAYEARGRRSRQTFEMRPPPSPATLSSIWRESQPRRTFAGRATIPRQPSPRSLGAGKKRDDGVDSVEDRSEDGGSAVGSWRERVG